jgi:trehalose 6-phosphate synthase
MFVMCCESVLGYTPRAFVAPAAIDPDDICATAQSDECQREYERLDALVGDRQLIVRVDRLELSKNINRGFLAFEELLATRPELLGRVIFWAKGYPSRQNLPEYLAYRQEVETIVRRINRRWGTSDWTPIIFDASDNFVRSVAALRRADVFLVNPVRDGLNLVAKEAALVNERDAVLCLSRESGVWDEVGEAALGLNPFDIVDTASVLERALQLPGDEKSAMAERLVALATARRPADWLTEQLAAAG